MPVTYSIVARDPQTGELGVAVQSHYFQVGPAVPWARAGVGAVATQSLANISYGPVGLKLMQSGYSAEQALRAVTTGDDHPELRQCAMVDNAGRVAAHTGAKCIPEAGHHVGDGFSCQANLMEHATVWDAMADAYTSSPGPLAERLLAALDAAEDEGGDIRGRQSAALLVVTGNPSGKFWEERTFDLRVEDSDEPLTELRRLYRIRQAYAADSEADQFDEAGDAEAAKAARLRALEMAPDKVELRFWAGMALCRAGDVREGALLVAEAIRAERRWDEVISRLVRAQQMTGEQAEMLRSLLVAAEAK